MFSVYHTFVGKNRRPNKVLILDRLASLVAAESALDVVIKTHATKLKHFGGQFIIEETK